MSSCAWVLGAGRQAPRRADAERGQLPNTSSLARSSPDAPELCTSRAFGAAERIAKAEFARGWWEWRARTGGQPPRLAAANEPADSPGVLCQDRSGARTDQDADRGAGEPGHQREGDPEKAELRLIARHHPGHPDRGGCRVRGRHDAGDHPSRHEHPRAHLAQQEEPRGEPPQP
jgi:hypothetical protein